MKRKALHIVSFDIPYPPTYGGVIDVFFKIKALYDLGIQITLHCFEYHRPKAKELEQYCSKIIYYKRNTSLVRHFSTTPYIVKSRKVNNLLENLIKNQDPILFEGLHSTAFLGHPLLSNRVKGVRAHNIEHDYYNELSQRDTVLFKRFFFATEGKKLKQYESILHNADIIFSVTQADFDYFVKSYPTTKHLLIPSFQQNRKVKSKCGKGKFALYHGNLGVAENNEVALFLVEKVFNEELSMPLYIAGSNPTKQLIKKCKNSTYITLVSNPDQTEMERLIADAQLHLLPTFQPTGLKLKLLVSLFGGRFVVANSSMLIGTPLAPLCNLAEDAESFKNAVIKLKDCTFDETQISQRAELLSTLYNNNDNAQTMVNALF